MFHRVLFVEDDTDYALTLMDYCYGTEFRFSLVDNVEVALSKMYSQNFDILLLDINLKKSSGIELLKELKRTNNYKPTIFLTSDSSSATAVECFQIGCEDYVRKNCDMMEIVERLRVCVKKNYLEKSDLVELRRGYTYNIATKKLIKEDEEIKLPQKEHIMLDMLVKKRGITVTWEDIAEGLWAPSDCVSYASVRVYVNSLKKILGRDSIINSKGVGYRLVI